MRRVPAHMRNFECASQRGTGNHPHGKWNSHPSQDGCAEPEPVCVACISSDSR
jgi:hypothetical protein